MRFTPFANNSKPVRVHSTASLKKEANARVELKAGYALSIGESTVIKYEFGEGLIGQSAASGNTLYVDDVPEGYIKIVSGLGSASPKYLLDCARKKATTRCWVLLNLLPLPRSVKINASL